MTPAEEVRAAAAKLRNPYLCMPRELTMPLAAWLEFMAEVWTFERKGQRDHALAVARGVHELFGDGT